MERNPISLSSAIEGFFIAAHARRLSPHTLSDYDTTFRRFETFLATDPPLADVTPAHVREFLNSLGRLSDKTLLNYHTGLSALWTWALQERLADRHIVRAVDPPKPETPAIVPYTEDDVRAMLAACQRSRSYVRPGKRTCNHARPTAIRDRAIILLLVDTGLRASELCSVRLSDLDLKNRRIVVMGKGDRGRVVKFAPSTAQAIWRYLATRDDTQRGKAHLFQGQAGLPMSRHSLRRLVKRAGDRAGVPRANVHRFRHTFAIQFLRNHPNVYALQEMLGHTSLDMVRRYLKIAQADIDRAHEEGSPVANWGL